jgi:hypothetical protein
MKELMQFDVSLPENRERSPTKITQVNLFREGSSIRNTKKDSKETNMSSIFSESVKSQ